MTTTTNKVNAQTGSIPKHNHKANASWHLTPLATYQEFRECHLIFNYRYRRRNVYIHKNWRNMTTYKIPLVLPHGTYIDHEDWSGARLSISVCENCQDTHAFYRYNHPTIKLKSEDGHFPSYKFNSNHVEEFIEYLIDIGLAEIVTKIVDSSEVDGYIYLTVNRKV